MINETILKYLTGEEQKLIREAVQKAESLTSGEIAPMLVAASDDYREAATHAAIIAAVLLSLTVAVIIDDTSIWHFIPFTLFLFLPLLWLFRRLPALKLAFTPAARVRAVVQRRAVSAFYENGLHRTREENGILIFISLLEHRVWILGDRGVNAVIPPERWSFLAALIASGIRKGRMVESLVAAIAEVGGVLAEHFPRREDDTNELPDLLEG
ncbi:MAG: TPM domain-containing protein [Desulfuromonadaceae bacterium]|nr:TPM domain-containing protein [Desulfuromonadaceae bacterium]MDD2854161.1 TPM domain-containing protein [Desulfuromonadaceae bacterium]